MTDTRPRNPEMDAIVKGIHASPAFTLENAAKAVNEAMERRAFEAWYANPPPVSSSRERAFSAWQAAIKHERAECAKVCEELQTGDFRDRFRDGALYSAAAAVRARSA